MTLLDQCCVNCHNQHEDSTKKDWKVGDVRGVVEVFRPLDRDEERTSQGLRGTYRLIAAASFALLLGMAVMVGVRALWRMPGGDLSAFALMATLYVVMHFIYAYVDMSWEAQSMIYVGVMMGLINNLERITVRPALHSHHRWVWQAQASSASELWDQP